MENTQVEMKELAAATTDASERAKRELLELQLTMLAGGAAEVSLA